MYSKNDYRYYLEHRLAESDDYLAHYGIKGMKWKKRLKRGINTIKNEAAGIRRYYLNDNVIYSGQDNTHKVILKSDPKTRRIYKMSKARKNGRIETMLVKNYRKRHPDE